MIQEKTDSAIQKMIEKNPGETELRQKILIPRRAPSNAHERKGRGPEHRIRLQEC